MQAKQTKITKCGTYTWFGFVLPFEEKLRLIREAGFDTICTWWDDLFAEIDGRKEEHFRQAEEAGLYVEHTHLPYFGCDELWRPGLDGDELEKRYLQSLGGIAASGIKTAVLHPFEKYVPENGNWDVFAGRIGRIADESARQGVRLAIENLADKRGFLRVLDFLSDNPFVGMCFDSGHNHVTGKNDFALLERYPGRLFALHVHDNHGQTDEHLLPGEGTVDWAAFMNTLRKTGFEGSLMLEACYPMDLAGFDQNPEHEYHAPPVSPEEYLAEAKKSCNKVLHTEREDLNGRGIQDQA